MSDLDFDDRFSVQSELAERLLGSDEMLHKYNSSYIADGTVKYKNGKYIITATEPDKASLSDKILTYIKENKYCILTYLTGSATTFPKIIMNLLRFT